MRVTWIYLIKDKTTGMYKIGQSIDPVGRLKTLRKQDTLQPTPNDFELVEAWWAEERMERELHGHFHAQRERGEWFELNEGHIERIRAIFISNHPHSVLISQAADLNIQVAIAAIRSFEDRLARHEREVSNVQSITSGVWSSIHTLEGKVKLLEAQWKTLEQKVNALDERLSEMNAPKPTRSRLADLPPMPPRTKKREE